MKADSLILAIVQQQDADRVTDALIKAHRSVTRISSIGGFLQLGNVTMLIGVERGLVQETIDLLATHCQKRTVFLNAGPQMTLAQTPGFIAPMEAEVGGATVFLLPIERHIHIDPTGEPVPVEIQAEEAGGMKLVLVIVSEPQSDDILSMLIAANYRATLMSTTGGFLRKGNATLLIGVESKRLEYLVEQVQEVCRARHRLGKADSGATIFVLNMERYERV